MTWSPKGICAVALAILTATPSQLLTAQQATFQSSGFQTSFLAPASVRVAGTGVLPNVTDLDHLPYLR
jgi:hypothetical protein